MSAQEYKKVEKAFNTLTENIMKKVEKGEISETTMGVKFYVDRKNVLQNNKGSNNSGSSKVGCC